MRKTKIKNKLMLLLPVLCLCWPVVAQTHDPTVVRLVNSGKMHVALNSGSSATSLFVPDGVLADSMSSIVQNGVTVVGGNFYQNAKTKVFKLGTDSFTVGTGIVRFTTASVSQRKIALWGGSVTSDIPARYSAADTAAANFFKRGNYYIAFPNVEIATTDTIHVGAVLGMDATTVSRTVAANNKGALYLESGPVLNSASSAGQIFDASLRVTGSTVSPGSVVIEKYVLPFRDNSANKYLYPFASPYTNQRAGYFAGNWVRAPRVDGDGNYPYPYANLKDSKGKDYIDESQYVRWAPDPLPPKSPYLLRLQPDGYGYDLPFVITGGEEHNLEKFIFNGTPYNLPHVEEQKFTDNITLTPVAGKKLQWIIGNSYTSAISIDSLLAAVGRSPVKFSKYLYIYEHGATTYESYDMTNPANIPDIPSMSVFMLIVSSNNTSTQPFTITPNMQVHGKSFADDGSGPAKSPAQSSGALTFRLTPEDNPYIYDRAYIVLRSDASEGTDSWDISKSLNPSGDYFNLYGGSLERALSKNVLPETVTETKLLVSPPKHALSCRLTVEGVETVHAPSLQLYDTKLNVWTNLYETPEYVFTSGPNDSPERFTLYFKSPTGIENVNSEAIYACYENGQLHLNRLTGEDNGSKLSIYNMSGLQIMQTEIDNYPHYSTALNISQGVYIAKLEGNRNTVLKFIKR